MQKILSLTLIFALVLSLTRCANVVSPTGGPKDTVPPIVLQASPENQSTNFSGKEIHITFDEYVTLNNPNNNIMISPPLENNPEYKLNGKSLIIKFKEPLKSDVTYSINFGEAIKDLHEGNIFKDYSFTFSTGDVIDTLTFEGKVLQAADHKPSPDFFVMLYTENDTLPFDSLPYLVKPNYVTKTDKEGKFKFSGLKENEYLIFALKDGNSNLRFDLPNEEIGFTVDNLQLTINSLQLTIDSLQLTGDSLQLTSDSLQLTSDSLQLTSDSLRVKDEPFILYSFLEEDSVQRLLKKEVPEDGLLRFAFSYPAKDVKIEVMETLPDSFAIYPTHSANYDSILWYFTPNKDSLLLAINYDTLINDTSQISLKPRKTEGRRRGKEQTISSLNIANNVTGGKLKPEQDLIFTFKEPVTEIIMRDTSWYIVDKDTIINDLQFTKIDSFGLKYKLEKTFVPEQSYKIIIPDSVFFSFKGVTNDTTKITFKVPALSEYGNIFITIEKPEDVSQVIVELLDDKEKVVERQIIGETSKVGFTNLVPKKYKLKATLDRDGNGRWSPGHYGRKILPENVIYHKDIFDVKANWDIDLEEVWSF
ncbi:MAG: Ig-like domain-containing protein [Bacteroidales bacterium]|nr:Ig-like domain-containing protein [Bacteroidales bacterium]